MRIATSLIEHRPGEEEPRARDPAPSDTSTASRARAEPVGRQARRRRGRGRDRRPAHDAVLEPLPAVPVSELGAREHRHRRLPGWKHAVQSSTDRRRARDRDRRADGRRQGLRQQRLLGHLPDHLGGVRAVRRRSMAGELVDGFVQQYRDGGWIARWSSPGYANLMTGTSSDVAFADAYVKGVRGFDARDAYDAAVKNATVAPPGNDPNEPERRPQGPEIVALPRLHAVARVRGRLVGARGLHQRLRHRQHGEGAGRPRRAAPGGGAQGGAEYFLSRAQNYVNMFDPAIGFFQGRERPVAGSRARRVRPAGVGPRARLHGDQRLEHRVPRTTRRSGAGQPLRRPGRARAQARHVLRHPETAKFPGSYGGTIHEMLEARDVRMGQWGFSNQVSHHIP